MLCNKQPELLETFLHTKGQATLTAVLPLSLLSLSLAPSLLLSLSLSLTLSLSGRECKSTTTMIRSGEVRVRIVVMVFVNQKLTVLFIFREKFLHFWKNTVVFYAFWFRNGQVESAVKSCHWMILIRCIGHVLEWGITSFLFSLFFSL